MIDESETMEIDAMTETRKCYSCGIKGHLIKNCRKPRKKKFNNDNKKQGNKEQTDKKL